MDEIEKMQEEVRKLECRVERKLKLLTLVIVLWLVNAVLSFNTKLDVWAMMYHQKEVSKIRDEQISLIDQILVGHEEIDTQLEDFLTQLKENGGENEK